MRKNTKIQLLLTTVAIIMIGLFILTKLSIIPKKLYTICPIGYERYKFCPPLNPELAWCEYRCKKIPKTQETSYKHDACIPPKYKLDFKNNYNNEEMEFHDILIKPSHELNISKCKQKFSSWNAHIYNAIMITNNKTTPIKVNFYDSSYGDKINRYFIGYKPILKPREKHKYIIKDNIKSSLIGQNLKLNFKFLKKYSNGSISEVGESLGFKISPVQMYTRAIYDNNGICSSPDEEAEIQYFLKSSNENYRELKMEYSCSKMEPKLKPVIYLYPQHAMDIKVVLDYKGAIIADYPKYDSKIKGWEVKAYPDGRIINKADGLEYSYLFWEGMPQEKIHYDLSSGFIVKGENTRAFLRDTLAKMGLTPKEYNEFIVYWYPLMKDNRYNLIHFAGEKYIHNAPLEITPKPDSILRVFMVYKPLDKKIKIKKQIIEPFDRVGFSVIEWGGTRLGL